MIGFSYSETTSPLLLSVPWLYISLKSIKIYPGYRRYEIMKHIAVIGNRAITSPDFSLNDLPGSAGRIDILCRCVNSAFLLSHGIRKDVILYLILRGAGDPPKIITLDGRYLKHLNPDERSTGALLKIALKKGLGLKDGEMQRSTPGITVRRGDLRDLIKDGNFDPVIYLHEASRDIRKMREAIKEWLEKTPLFVLGDHIGVSREDEEFLDELDAIRVSLGPRPLHADHCITILLNEIDRIELDYA